MAQGQPFDVGRGTEIRAALCPPGGALPGNGNDNSTVALSNVFTSAVDALVDAGTTAVTLTAGSGIPLGSALILAGTWVGMTTPTGNVIPVQIAANIDASAAEVVSMTINAIDRDIPAGSTFEYPPIVDLRTSVQINQQGNRVTSYVFERGGHETGRNATLSSGLTISGNFSQNGPGYKLLDYSWREGLPVVFFITFPAPDALATRGTVYQGEGSVTSLPINAPSDNIITGDIEAAFDEIPTVYDPTYA